MYQQAKVNYMSGGIIVEASRCDHVRIGFPHDRPRDHYYGVRAGKYKPLYPELCQKLVAGVQADAVLEKVCFFQMIINHFHLNRLRDELTEHPLNQSI